MENRDDRHDRDELDLDMRRYYAQRAPEYDDWYDRLGRYDDPATNAAWHAEVARLGQLADGFGEGRLLDIACGTGRWTIRFAANPRVTSVTAFDQAPEMLEQTRARMVAAGHDVRDVALAQGDAYALPFAAGAFDSCFFGFFLSHVPAGRLPSFLGEVRRVLRPGGVLLAYVPTQWSQLYPFPANFYDDYTHVRAFSRVGLQRLLEDAGFARTRIEGCTPPLRPWQRPIGAALSRTVPFLWRAVAVNGGAG